MLGRVFGDRVAVRVNLVVRGRGRPVRGGGRDAVEAAAGAAAKNVRLWYLENGPRVSFERLTLCTPGDGRELVTRLNLEVLPGSHLLVTGPNGAGKSAPVPGGRRVWDWGGWHDRSAGWSDMVVRPAAAVHGAGHAPRPVDLRLSEKRAHRRTHLGRAGARVKFDAGRDPRRRIRRRAGLAEHAVRRRAAGAGVCPIALARPKFVILDGSTGALDAARERLLYSELVRSDVTFISIGDSPSLRDHHDIRLELLEDGEWRLRPVREALCA